MTCFLRYVDVRWLLPKREAFAAQVDSGEVAIAGHAVAVGEDDGSVKKSAELCIKAVEAGEREEGRL